ncbi:retrovirus-related Pol polyprotein from transposon 412 [Trichonephila clavipes]|nr:retrovirus-related Pol polyprotein from transposon 412 [Trichonephila clavipes]
MVVIEGRSVLTKFIILPKAKGNRTLLGTDFLSSAGLVLDVKNTCWYFWDNPTHKYPFGEELDTPPIVEKMSSNTCQTPVPAQRFEILAIDLFGPLPERKDGKRWIFIIEDCTTKWVELFALPNVTPKECAITLIEEVLLRYGIPRRLISDNGTQFVSAVMQQICYLLNIHQSLIPVYHPQVNSVERNQKCETTGQTAAFLNFGRELRIPSEIVNDIRVVIQNDNFVPDPYVPPYLKKFAKFSTQLREVVEEQQDNRKFYGDKKRKAAPTYQPGEHVFVASHPLSNAAQGRRAKLMPRRDGPYVILTQRSPSSYGIASLDNPRESLGVYLTSALTPCNNDKVKCIIPLRKRGRPPKVPQTPGSSSRRRRNQRGRISCQVIYSQFGLAIHQNDHQARRRFVKWAQNEIAVATDFHKQILFSDEAHFWLNGYVNKHNCRIWSEANPQVYVETLLHPEKLTVWCALWAGGILLQKR